MSTEILKHALIEAQKREMAEIPTEEELSKLYTFSPAFKEKIRKLINNTKNRYFDFLGINVRKSAAIFIAIVAVVSTALSVEAVRRPIINFFIEIYEKFSRLTFSGENLSDAPDVIEDFYTPTDIPIGYYLIEENNFGDSYQLVYSNGVYEIIFKQLTLNNTTIGIDTEDDLLEPIQINGNQGWIRFSKNTMYIIWNNGQYVFTVNGIIDLKTIENMANSVEIKK